MRRPLPRIFLGIACAALSVLAYSPADAAIDLPDGFANELVVSGLNEPNSMAFLPDWRILVTEQRTGRIRLLVNNSFSTVDPIYTVQNVEGAAYERGLQGIAID